MEIRKSVAAGAIAGSLLLGGAVGAAWFVPRLAGAQTTTTPPATDPGNTRFKANEDPAHEAGESAEREAAEDAGRGFEGRHGPHGQFGSNEDPAHEAAESAEREAAEDAAKADPGQAPPSAPSTPATPATPAT